MAAQLIKDSAGLEPSAHSEGTPDPPGGSVRPSYPTLPDTAREDGRARLLGIMQGGLVMFAVQLLIIATHRLIYPKHFASLLPYDLAELALLAAFVVVLRQPSATRHWRAGIILVACGTTAIYWLVAKTVNAVEPLFVVTLFVPLGLGAFSEWNGRWQACVNLLSAASFLAGVLTIPNRLPETAHWALLLVLSITMSQLAAWRRDSLRRRLSGRIVELDRSLLENRREAMMVNLLRSLTLALTDAHDLASALQITLDMVIEAVGWAMGEAWVPTSNGGLLTCSPAWAGKGAAVDKIRHASTETSFAPNQGIPGKVWTLKRPIWSPALSEYTPVLSADSQQATISFTAAVGVPVLHGSEVVAVLVFLLDRSSDEDRHLMPFVSALAAQLGPILKRKQAEAALRISELALRQSERRLRAVIENAPIIFTTIDTEGVVTFSAGKELPSLGLVGLSLTGKRVFDSFPGPFSVSVRRALAGETFSTILEYNGQIFDAWLSPITTASGRVDGVLCVSTNVTERIWATRELRRSEEYFRALIENTSDVVATYDLDGSVRFVSPSVRIMLGFSPEELVGSNVFDQIHPDDRAHARQSLERLLTDPSIRELVEARVRRADGSWCVVEAAVRALMEGDKAVGLVSSSRDISERKRVQEELQQALERARQSERLKSAFLANMSHEIRTPLHSILGFSAILADHLESLGDHSQDDALDAISRAGSRLLSTVHSVLEISKIEAGAYELSPAELEVRPLVERLILDLQPRAAERGLKLEAFYEAKDARILFDEYCFTQALSNLLDNAIKFTPHGSVSVKLYRCGGGSLALDVADTGVGIDSKYLPTLFDAFSQEDSDSTRHYEGAGLGLALVRRYMELNGAAIYVCSNKNQGTCFTVQLPEAIPARC